jgi:2',3'-cyclic-nucleotide 2'-phosphodiesterase (5'-nucleotidase family)
MLEELPFGNRVVKIEVTGEVLRQALEHAFSEYQDGAGRFLQLSGVAVNADLNQPVGSRMVSATVGGEPLDPARIYTLAVTDFNANGGDGFEMLRDAPRILGERDGPLLASSVMAHMRKLGEVAPRVEGRIRLQR